jgi:hypothetical protein
MFGLRQSKPAHFLGRYLDLRSRILGNLPERVLCASKSSCQDTRAKGSLSCVCVCVCARIPDWVSSWQNCSSSRGNQIYFLIFMLKSSVEVNNNVI